MNITDLTVAKIESVLATYQDPYLKQDLVTSKAVKSIKLDGSKISIEIVLGYSAAGFQQELVAALTHLLQASTPATEIQIHLSSTIISHVAQAGAQPIPGIKNVIAIASGKGGVGKSTTAVNLALALQAEGARVGILDADIYGPSQPLMLGVSKESPISTDSKTLEPVMSHGIQSMSIGYLVEQETAMIWRGPMVTSALQQLLKDTNWKDVDYLIIDLPPGTGDIQLTLAQKIAVNGVVIVTTPQDIALADVRKAIAMFNKVQIPILGIVENMAIHICSECGHQEAIFGSGGGEKMASQYQMDLLGSLPLTMAIREQTDSGHPTVIAEPEGAVSKIYRHMARQIAAKISLQAKSYASKFPKIVVQ